MTEPAACDRDHSRLPYIGGIVIGCTTCRDAGLGPADYSVHGRGWRCRSCGWTMIAPETWGRHVRSSSHQESAHALDRRASLRAELSSLMRDVENARMERRQVRALTCEELDRREAEANDQIVTRTQKARAELAEAQAALFHARADLAQERAKLNEIRARAKEVSGFVDAEAKARAATEAEKRKAEDAERAKREAEERRTAEVDRRLLSGEDPKGIAYSVGFTSEAKVHARQIALAKMNDHRGKPWAEAALDREIARMAGEGVQRDEIKRLLGVGAGRIRRVRRGLGLGTERVGSGTGPGPERDQGFA